MHAAMKTGQMFTRKLVVTFPYLNGRLENRRLEKEMDNKRNVRR